MYYYFHPVDPYKVLRDTNSSGDDRHRGILAIKEPLQNGGTAEQQTLIIDMLKYSALSDPQAVCRMASYDVLRKFKDPRAAEILKEAYYKTTSFAPETGNILRCQVLEALGDTKNPAAVELLVRVLREPPASGPEVDKQAQLDERNAAARALGHFSDYQATKALAETLTKEQDVALRNEVHHSLVEATGRDLPADATAWNNLLNTAPGQPLPPAQDSMKDRFMRFVGWSQSPENQAAQPPGGTSGGPLH
jgi:HEAT repeat protein